MALPVEPAALPDLLRELPAVRTLLPALGDATGVHLVGGAVRDALLGGTPVDLDLVVEGAVEPVARRLAGHLGGAVELHERFGTATVRAAGRTIDLAGARAESYARPGVLPDVRRATLPDDLARRDFTVNAMAAALAPARFGELCAVPGALEDLAGRRLRVLHPGSFGDDPTRLLRLARYAGRLGFVLEAATERLARTAVGDDALVTVSAPRRGRELRLLLAEPAARAGLEVAARLGALGALGARLVLDRTLVDRALRLLPADGRPERLLLGALGLGEEAERLARWLDAIEVPRDARAVVLAAHAAPMLARALERAGDRPSAIAGALADAPPEAAALAGALGPEGAARAWLESGRHVALEVTGADLLVAGVAAGPAVGRSLARTLAARRDGLVAGRRQELAYALAEAADDDPMRG